MIARPEMRSPEAALQSGDRAEIANRKASFNISTPEPEANFPALCLARRYLLASPLPQAVATLAQLGGRFG
jgi:hypothetical protein